MTLQITLDQTESETLQAVAERTGKTTGELVHEALTLLASRYAPPQDRLARLRAGRGIWRDRADLPDWNALRAEFDRD